jgi:hypothetical protein
MSTPNRPYVPTHTVTENYQRGMLALVEGRLVEAIEILSNEPSSSRCHALARGNLGLALLRLERFEAAEVELKTALTELDRDGCPHPPSGVQFARNLGEALVGQGRRAEALRVFNGVGNLAHQLMAEHPEMAAEIELEKAHAFNSWGSAFLLLSSYDAAIDIFRVARDIYWKYQDRRPVGRSETLTNYAHALRLVGRQTEAELALQEALAVAEIDGHTDQVQRIHVALVQLGSALVHPDKIYETTLQAADEALLQGRYGTSYLRRCICADLAVKRGDIAVGLDVVAKAIELEPRLERHDLNRAKLRMMKAKLLERSGASPEEIIEVLTEGAHLWFARISQPLMPGDFAAITQEMHEHFRMLARTLLDAGRVRDALMSFEAGRALAHGVEVDRKFLGRVVAVNPFAADGRGISNETLRHAQGSLAEHEVVITIAILPPDIVAFVVGRETVTVNVVPMPANTDAHAQFFEQIGAIPVRLQEGVGVRALPELIHDLARALCTEIGDRVVRALMPYSALHDVPWRAVLRYVGVPWAQLRGSVEFGLLLRDGAACTTQPARCVALGYGVAGVPPYTIDLGDEAREFAAAYGPNGSCEVPCSRRDVEAALRLNSIALLSCHGAVGTGAAEGQLVLYLADGAQLAADIFPDKVLAPIVVLSACESGVYRMAWGDFPVGAAASLVRGGARYCVGARFRLDAHFSASFFRSLARRLALGTPLVDAVSESSDEHEALGHDLWRELACVEVVGGP